MCFRSCLFFMLCKFTHHLFRSQSGFSIFFFFSFSFYIYSCTIISKYISFTFFFRFFIYYSYYIILGLQLSENKILLSIQPIQRFFLKLKAKVNNTFTSSSCCVCFSYPYCYVMCVIIT